MPCALTSPEFGEHLLPREVPHAALPAGLLDDRQDFLVPENPTPWCGGGIAEPTLVGHEDDEMVDVGESGTLPMSQSIVAFTAFTSIVTTRPGPRTTEISTDFLLPKVRLASRPNR